MHTYLKSFVAAAMFAVASAQASENYANGSIWAKPLSNPVYNDIALIKRELNVLYIYQTLPSHIESGGSNYDLDGDLNALAIQCEIPITDTLSVVANKSGYIDFNPDSTLSKESGMTDLSAGLKWAFLSCESYTLALRATVEFTTGETDVFQGNGDGNISPALLGTYMTGNNAFNGVLGAVLPFDDDEESTMGYASIAHAYRITEWLSSHLELNWFRVLESGNGDAGYKNQLRGAEHLLPTLLDFEGGDVINFGARNADEHPDFVSVAAGARMQLCDCLSLGAAYEIPLTKKEHGLMAQRVNVHLTLTF